MAEDSELELEYADMGDDDLDFDTLSMDASIPEDDRSPSTKVRKGAYEGFLTRITDRDEITDAVKENLPDGISAGVDQAEMHLEKLQRAKTAFTTPIKQELPRFKREVNKLTPTIRRYAGDRVADKFDSLTKTSSSGPVVDPDELEASQGMNSVFGAWIQQQESRVTEEMATRLLDNKTAEERFGLTYRMLSGMSQELKILSLYNQDVNFKWQQKTLELQYKSYHIFRNLLKLNTESSNATITELKQITKNTGLPDLVKQQTSETFRQLFLENWQGRSIDSITQYSRGYLNKFYANLTKKAETAAAGITDTMSQVGDAMGMLGDMQNQQAEMEEMMGDINPNRDAAAERRDLFYKQLGGSVGNNIAGSITEKVAKTLGEFLTKNKTAAEANEYLKYATANPGMILNDTLGKLANGTNKAGDKAWYAGIAEWFADARPTRGTDLEHVKSEEINSIRDAIQMDRGMRDSQTREVPGWLSRIHHRLAQLVYGVDVEQTTYDHTTGTFTDLKTATENIFKKVQSDSDREQFNSNIDSVIEEMFKGYNNQQAKLGNDENALLRELIGYLSINSQGFRGSEFMNRDMLDKFGGYDDQTRDALNKILNDTLKDLPTNALTFRGMGDTDNIRALKVSKAFKKTSGSVDLSQDLFNRLSDTSSVETLRNSGLMSVGTDGALGIDHDALNKYRVWGRDNPDPVDNGDRSSSEGGSGLRPPVGGKSPQNPTVDFTAVIKAIKEQKFQGGDIIDVRPELNVISGSIIQIHDLLKEKLVSFKQETPPPQAEMQKGEYFDSNSKSLLSGILTVLGEQYAASTEYYNAELNSRGFSSKIGDLFSSGLGAASKTIGGLYKTLLGAGKGTLGFLGKLSPIKGTLNFLSGVKSGLSEAFTLPPDIWVTGDETPRLLGRDLYRGIYRGWDNATSTWLKNPIKTKEDIRGYVIDKEGNTVISDEDIKAGLYNVTKGKMETLGKGAVALITKPFGWALGATSFAVKQITKVVKFGGDMAGKAKKALTSFKDTYIVDEEGNLGLLCSAIDLKAGRIFVEIDGKKVQVTKMADLVKGSVYRLGADGELVILAGAETVRNGLRDFKGNLMKFGGMIASAATGIKDLAFMPFKFLGRGLDAIRKSFEAKAIKSLILALPNHVMFEANVVHLYTSSVINAGKGDAKKADAGTKGGDSNVYKEFKEDVSSAVDSGKKKTADFLGALDNTRVNVQRDVELKFNENANKLKSKMSSVDSDIERASVSKAIRSAYDRYLSVEGLQDPLTISAFARKYKDTILATADLDKNLYDKVLSTSKEKVVDAKQFVNNKITDLSNKDDAGVVRKMVDRLYDKYLSELDEGEEYLSKYEFAQKYADYIAKAAKCNSKRVLEIVSLKTTAIDYAKAGQSKVVTELSSFKDRLMARFTESRKVEGDFDGDGTRDNSWRELYKDRMAKRAAKKDKKKEKKEDDKKQSWLGPLLGMLGTGISLLGTLAKGVVGAKAVDAIMDAAVSTVLGSGGDAGKAKKGGFLNKIWSGVKTAAKVGGSLIFGRAGLIRGAITVVGGLVSYTIALPALALAGVVAGSLYVAKQRKLHGKLGWLEYGRYLSYGYFTGNEDTFSDKKIKLRKFEQEMLGLLKDRDGTLDFSLTTTEIYNEYGNIFGDINLEDGSNQQFKEWFERRFKPVLFKWLKLTSDYEKGVKAREPKKADIASHGYVNRNAQNAPVLTLFNLDEKLSKLERNFFMNSAIRFPELPWDPLMMYAAPHINYPIEANRGHVEKYYGEFINEKAKTIQGGTAPKGTGVLKDLPKMPAANNSSFSNTALKQVKDASTKASQMSDVVQYPGAPIPIPKTATGAAGSNSGKRDATNFTAYNYKDSFQIIDKVDERIAKYNQYLVSESLRKGIDPEMIRSIIRAESAGKSDARSHVGAMGLMQLMPDTAKWLGVANPYNPIDNIRGGIKYMRYLLDMFKDPALAVMSYNMGQGRLKQFIERIKSDDPDDVIDYLEKGNAKRGYQYESVPYVRKIAKVFEERSGKPLSSRFDGGSVGVKPYTPPKRYAADESSMATAKPVVDKKVSDVAPPASIARPAGIPDKPISTVPEVVSKAGDNKPVVTDAKVSKGPTEVSIVNPDTSTADAVVSVKDALNSTAEVNSQLKDNSIQQTQLLQSVADSLKAIAEQPSSALRTAGSDVEPKKSKPSPVLEIDSSGTPTSIKRTY